ncbi:MAG: SpoIID/LytB domain-containing protein [Bacillota bacterium]
MYNIAMLGKYLKRPKILTVLLMLTAVSVFLAGFGLPSVYGEVASDIRHLPLDLLMNTDIPVQPVDYAALLPAPAGRAVTLASRGSSYERQTVTSSPGRSAEDKPLQEEGRALSIEPVVRVHLHDTGRVVRMPLEQYLEGVVAGETPEGWNIQALAAQAIAARTFTLKRLQAPDHYIKQTCGADVCTSPQMFQAYNAKSVDDNVRKAVAVTRGMVLTYSGELASTYFHSNSGGITASVEEAFPGASKDLLPYLVPVESPGQSIAPAYAKEWVLELSASELRRAAGMGAGSISSLKIGSRGPSGRVLTLLINGKSVSAVDLRKQLGSTRLKSLLINKISLKGNTVRIEGVGWGHGVGLDQWGAEAMARQGATFEEILKHYFPGTALEKRWN